MSRTRTTDYLRSTLIPHAERLAGHVLAGVRYWVLEGETTPEDISDAEFYFGGEIELVLTGQSPVFVSWLEGAGLPDSHFTLYPWGFIGICAECHARMFRCRHDNILVQPYRKPN